MDLASMSTRKLVMAMKQTQEVLNKKIFIASPYSIGDQEENVIISLNAANKILDAGLIPFVPLLSHYWHLQFPKAYEEWCRYDIEWLNVCGALLRLPGISNGADGEMRHAVDIGIPVFFSLEELFEYYGIER
jgi:hypothetical protein